MKKIYLASLSVVLFFGANAQKSTSVKLNSAKSAVSVNTPTTVAPAFYEKAIYLNEDFEGTFPPAGWSVVSGAASTITLPATQDWHQSANGNPGNSATVLYENSVDVHDQYLRTPAITMPATGNVRVEFDFNTSIYWHALTLGGDFDNVDISVVASTDGGLNWGPILWQEDSLVLLDASYSNDWETYTYKRAFVDLTAYVGGPDVTIGFHYKGRDGASFDIDNIVVKDVPPNDIQLVSSWVLGENNEGIEYGRTPLDQLDANLTIGSEVINIGALDQTAIEVNANFVSFSSLLTSSSILAGNSVLLENLESPTLVVGLYEGTYTATSADETAGAEFFNNTGLRNFEVTNNIYSTDGIGVHPAANLTVGSIGTDSFGADSADEFIIANRYHIKNNAMISGMRVMLAAGTDVGAELIGVVMDTTTWFADDITPLLQTADIVAVTATDIANGYIDLWFSWVETLPANSYMFGVQLYSNANTANIMILDDQTVAQPSDASMIYTASDLTVYTNGEAVAIRLLMGDQWGLGLNENTLSGVSIYPNPSEGIVNITNDNNTENSIEVYDLLGNSILSTSANTATTVDLSSNASGIYMIVVSNENGSIVERVSIK